MQMLSHPNIVRIHEVIHTTEHVNVVLEYCQQGELFELIQRHGKVIKINSFLYSLAERRWCKSLFQITYFCAWSCALIRSGPSRSQARKLVNWSKWSFETRWLWVCEPDSRRLQLNDVMWFSKLCSAWALRRKWLRWPSNRCLELRSNLVCNGVRCLAFR